MFKLLRYFSLASAGVIFAIVTLLMIFFYYLSVEDLIRVGERQNEILARSIGNHFWTDFGPYLSEIKEADRETVVSKARTREISENLLPQIKGLPVLKVEILNLNGVIIFSTIGKLIGEEISNDTGFFSARDGRTTSEITRLKDGDELAQFAAGSEILSSNLPFRDDEGKVVGVFEIYSDITLLWADIEKHVLIVFAALLFALSLLYVILYQVVRRADKILKSQHLELQSMANLDHLTGLPNRRELDNRIKQALARNARTPSMLALMFLDIDGFKDVNDKLGHDAGDQTLKLIASRIEKLLRKSDEAGRVGGDEFAVVLEGGVTRESTAVVAEKLLAEISLPYVLSGGQTVNLTASIGIAFAPNDGEDLKRLFSAADAVMYKAKNLGKSRYAMTGG